MGAFHAYDIRGIYPTDFTKEDAFLIGCFLPELLATKKWVVGRDCRLSSPEIHEYLLKGLCYVGADVYDLGLATTPLVYYATSRHHFEGSVQITASHNGPEYNGMKISCANAMPVGYDSGLHQLEEWLHQGKKPQQAPTPGRVIPFDISQEYLEFQRTFLPNLEGLRIALDFSNGMAGLFVKNLLGTGPNLFYINDTQDGRFPGHDPNPLIPKNIEQLQAVVRQEHCHLGIIYDGDADRVMFTDEQGRFIPPDLIIALLGNYFLSPDYKGTLPYTVDGRIPVLQDIRSSKAVSEYLTPMGAQLFTWRVGRAYAAPKLKEINGLFGGELAGHYYFRDFYYSDSGILASLLVLNVVTKKGNTPLSALIDGIRNYENSGELNFKIAHKQEAMDALRTYFTARETPTASYDFDGYRVEFPQWWFNVRPSNTEPYLRFIAEASSADLLQEKLDAMRAVLAPYL